ncbi:hypothetical protein H1W37_10465 [Stappia taiwanensis]|uniref:Uncharacterized protein n=1 Tax=Stappia taiwanensis TaxID=992267 RepID=A0A838XTV4_9HYPH|nr:hypothetical protein [Stappia taiwanensis]MBA4612078.1 hypothetical protein [Stappia taiwanensis]
MANETNRDTRPSAREVRATLTALLETPPLARSPKVSSLLTYLVTAKLEGTAEDLTETAIAGAVFNQHDNFNPRSNPIVRVNASRLRNLLKSYYADAGADDAIQIRLADIGYEPVFSDTTADAEAGQSVPPEETPVPATPADGTPASSPARQTGPMEKTGEAPSEPAPEAPLNLRQRLRAPASTALVLGAALAAVLTSIIYIHVALQFAPERPALTVTTATAAPN